MADRDLRGVGVALGVTVAFLHPPADRSGTRRLLPVWGGMALVGYVGPTAIHFAHGYGLRGVGHLALRVLAPPTALLIGLIGYCVSHEFASDCGDQSLAPSLLAGTIAAAAIDVAALAWDDARPAPRAPASVAPAVAPLAGGALVGARGWFR